MAGQSTISNTFETFDEGNGLIDTLHINENALEPQPGDHQHFVEQATQVTASGDKLLFGNLFDNGGLTSSGPGLTFNTFFHDFQTKETFHENNHVIDHSLQENTNTLLDAIQQPQADLANLQQAAADTVSTHDAGLQPDLHAANVQASAFHLV